MFVVLERRIKMPEFTVGDWIIDGKKLCDTMEPTDRGLHQGMSLAEIKAKKVPGKTAIPYGRYKIKMTYSPKYKRMMPLITPVIGFDGVRVHSGNSSKDSLACVLLGEHNIPDTIDFSKCKVKIDEDGWVFEPPVLTEKDKEKMNWISNSRMNVQIFEKLLTQAGGECDFEVR